MAQNTCLKDRKVSGRLVRRCAPGTELVDWLLSLSPSIHTRAQAAAMWQALLEEGVISHESHKRHHKATPIRDLIFLKGSPIRDSFGTLSINFFDETLLLVL
ncbi:hypothetical protein NQ317_015695 [Molorchus minor]|uniref:DEP domain-containing protein n=1 Tax=Molorchus minor TaxID=1323400 RepID=A0ABQ9JP95_9CUCU|nr:hypothetical protein NQ317_015695 [Molorchus minor]